MLETEALGCELCPTFRERARNFCVGPIFSKNSEAGILLVLDNPSDEDFVAGGPTWKTDDWTTLQVALDAVEFGPEQVGFTWATKCPAGWTGKKELGKEHIENCRPWLHREIEEKFPNVKTILALGRIAAASVLSIPMSKVSSYKGKINEVIIGLRTLKVIVSVHPYQAMTSAFELEALQHDLNIAKIMSDPEWKPFDMLEHKKTHFGSYHLVDTHKRAMDMVNDLLTRERVAFDIESRGLDPWHMPTPKPEDTSKNLRFVTSIQFSPGPDEAYFVQLCHKDDDPMAEKDGIREQVVRFFKDYKHELVAFNGKFDQVGIAADLGVVPDLKFDVMIVDHLRRGLPARSLKRLAWWYSPYGGYEESFKTAGEKLEAHEHDSYYYELDDLFWYGCLDADVTWRAAKKLKELSEKDPKVKFMSYFLSEASTALAGIETDGWRIDNEYLEKYGETQTTAIEKAQDEIRKAAPEAISLYEAKVGKTFNPSSSTALGAVLYDYIGLPVPEQTAAGKPSTAKGALKALKDYHPLVSHVLVMRKAEKAYNAFYKRWKTGQENGRLHFRYNLIKYQDADTGEMGGAATGRLSSSGAAGNAQQITKDDVIRRVFIPDDDESVILDVDFSTLEYVIAAIYSKDPKLCSAFMKGYDIHAAVTAEMFGGTAEEMMLPENKKLRQKGKTMNFSVLYGAGAKNVADQLGVSEDEAKEFLSTYQSKFPVLFGWIDRARKRAQKLGYSESKFGRIRYLPDAKLPRTKAYIGRVEAALRQAINGPIQGDASDVCLWGLVRLSHWLKETKKKARVKATIHDALILSVPLTELEDVYDAVVKILTTPGLPWLDGPKGPGVPLRVSVACGLTWGDLHDVQPSD